jgi:lysine N6-hydroxylase
MDALHKITSSARPDAAPAHASGAAYGPGGESVHDLIAIGCGPFNLGLAALASTVGLDVVAFEARPELRWHSGLMFDDAKLQLSFLADLVTLIDPTHPLSFLAYLHEMDRMYAFYIREDFHPTREEYEAYMRWVASKLPSVRFSHQVESVTWDAARERFSVRVLRGDGSRVLAHARDLVVGIGTEGTVPEALAGLPKSKLLHSADYLHRKCDIERARHLTVIGAGQSGAEVALDLLRRNLRGGAPMTWLTRTCSFAPLDVTKLVSEMTTPAYVRYFYRLPQEVKDRLVTEQWQHYKGISTDSIAQIHDILYQRELKSGLSPVELRYGVSVEAATLDARGQVVLSCRHRDTNTLFEQRTELVIAATGYRERRPSFLAPIEPLLRRDQQGRYRIRADHSIELADAVSGRVFVANADLHSHGVAAPDLSVCAYRNATILNTVAGREVYRLPKHTAFTSFEAPAHACAAETRARSLPNGEPVAPLTSYLQARAARSGTPHDVVDG